MTIARALAAALIAVASFVPAPRAVAAEGPPSPGAVVPAPPPVPAYAVVAATPGPRAGDPLHGARLEVQVHTSRLEPDPAGLLTLDSGTPGQARWDSIDYGARLGGRLAAEFPRGDRRMRLAYTWWGSWEDEQLVTGTIASRATPGGLLNVTSTTLGARETTRLGDIEVSATRPWFCTGGLSTRWGWGARYLRFREEAAFIFPTTVPVANAAVFQADLTSGLLAAEVCATASWRVAARLEVHARGAVFAGWMRRGARFVTVNVQPPPSDPSGNRDDLGYGAEAEVALAWRATPRGSVSVGYGVLVVGPVSRAHDAYDFSNVASNDLGPVFGDDTLVVQRVFVGLSVDL